jgi:DNA-binding PucR family transcriptional regulator
MKPRFAERRVMTPEEIVAFVEELAAAASGEAGRALRLAAAAIAERSRNGGAPRHVFWERLARGAYSDDAALRQEAIAAGVRPAPAYLAFAIEPAQGDNDGVDLRRILRDVFSSADGDLGMLERDASLELLVPVIREVDASKARTAATLLPKTLAKRHIDAHVSGGVAGACSPSEVPHYLERARVALAVGRRVFGPGRVVVYDDLGAYALLYSGATVDALRNFARGVLEPLREYDRKHQTELERTLRLYFSVGQNVKTAAAQLNVHRHTVFYRLRQIAEICRCDLGAPHDQLTLRLALAIDALHS